MFQALRYICVIFSQIHMVAEQYSKLADANYDFFFKSRDFIQKSENKSFKIIQRLIILRWSLYSGPLFQIIFFCNI